MRLPGRRGLGVSFAAVLSVALGAGRILTGTCGPFTDVAADAFCPFVLEIFYLGITTGTTPTTYDPTSSVTRLQMAAFLSRTVDGVLKRGSRRAALDQFWTTQNATVLGVTTLPGGPLLPVSDGADIWVADGGGSVFRVRASDGKLIGTWIGAGSSSAVLAAMGRILVVGQSGPGTLAQIDPSQPPGAATLVASNLGNGALTLAFDGARVWTANNGNGGPGSISIITPGPTIPWTVTTVTAGFAKPFGTLFDGSNVWMTDGLANTLLKLDANGAILQTVTVGASPGYPAFDGTNIWVPGGNFVSVVRPASGAVVGTPVVSASPLAAGFDGQRILVTHASAGTVSLFKAADLTSLGSFSTGLNSLPYGVCSDGISFWIALNFPGQLVRF